MSAAIFVNDKTWWFGSRIILYRLVEKFWEDWEVEEDTLSENLVQLMYLAEQYKLVQMNELDKADFQKPAHSLNRYVIENISLNHENADHTIIGFEIYLIELQTVLLLDPRAIQPPKDTNSIILTNNYKWLAPFWIWQFVTEWLLIDLQENAFGDAAKMIEHAWRNKQNYDLSTLGTAVYKSLVSLVGNLKHRYTYDAENNRFGSMHLGKNGDLLITHINDLYSKI